MPSSTKPTSLWLLAALAAPVAHFSGCGWLTGALAALTILPLTCLPGSWEEIPKPLALIQILWIGVITGILLKGSAASWPSDNDLVVPLTLLVLAACTGASSGPRIGPVLAFCMALMAIPVAVSAASGLELSWLRPSAAPWPMGLSTALLLPALPAAGERKRGRRALWAAILTLILAALVQGVLSPGVAVTLPDPFYQTARTLGPLEPVVAVGLSLGWYAMTTYLLQSAALIAKSSGIARKTASVLAVGTAAGFVILPQQPNALFVPVMTLFLWVLSPVFTKMKVFEKN